MELFKIHLLNTLTNIDLFLYGTLSRYLIYFCMAHYLAILFISVWHTISLTAAAQWLRCCAANRKVAGSIPAGVSGFFIDIKSFRSHYGPGVDSVSNRNEYQEYFLGVKAADA